LQGPLNEQLPPLEERPPFSMVNIYLPVSVQHRLGQQQQPQQRKPQQQQEEGLFLRDDATF
jgi:hypothetical protein